MDNDAAKQVVDRSIKGQRIMEAAPGRKEGARGPYTWFISGHLDLTPEEFEEHYAPAIEVAAGCGHWFVVGDAPGCDYMAQELLGRLDVHPSRVVVHHMLTQPRRLWTPSGDPRRPHFSTSSGFQSDDERDEAMTRTSDGDLAWVRPGKAKRNSGTAKNLQRRVNLLQEEQRAERRGYPRHTVDDDWCGDSPVLLVSSEPVSPESENWNRAVPVPPAVLKRHHDAMIAVGAAERELARVEAEIKGWRARQEIDPV